MRNTEAGHGELQAGNGLGPVPEDQELEDTASCCCHHGGTCTCATLKKEDTYDSDQHHPRPKPRLTTTQSDGHITVFANGHHKPVHRNNNSAHDNLPYKLPRSHTDHAHHAPSRRSVDSAVSDRFRGSASLPDQSGFNFATPPEMTPQLSQNTSTENITVEGFPFSSGQDVTNPSMDFFDFSQLGSTQVTGYNGYGMSMPPSDNTTACAMPYSGPASASASDADLDWSNIDWSTIGTFNDVQPALTYASSNTHSEFGEHTPPEEMGSVFGSHNFMRSMHDMPTQINQPSHPAIGAGIDVSNNQSVNQPNRWSLPPSFWTDANVGSSSNTSAESLASNSMTWGRPPTSTPANLSARSSAVPRSNRVESRPRPQAVYQKSTTLPGDPGWEQLLQQHQAGNLWAMEGVDHSIQQTESFANMATKTAVTTPMDSSLESTPDIGMLQRTDSDQQFFMDPESTNMFGFNNDVPNPAFYSAWPQ